MEETQLVVIGGGIAGCAAALRAAQYHVPTVWLRGNDKTRLRSRGQWVVNIDNMIGVHSAIVRDKMLGELRGDEMQAARDALASAHFHIGTRDIIANTATRITDHYGRLVRCLDEAAISARRTEKGFEVDTGARTVGATFAVLATGVMDRQPSIKKGTGESILDDPKWIYPFANRETVLYCIRCEGHLTTGTRAAVIGFSENAAQLALMLFERYGSTGHLLTNGAAPAWSEKTGRLLDHYGIPVAQARLIDVLGPKGRLRQIRLEDGTEVSVQFALVALGLHQVYNQLAVQLGAELTDPTEPTHLRHVAIDARGETSVPNFFAIGDLARRRDEPVMKQIYTAQEYAVRSIDTVDRRRRAARRPAL